MATSCQPNDDKGGENTTFLRRAMSWSSDLGTYIEETVKAGRSGKEVEVVRGLVDKVIGDCTSAQTWWDLLYHEECYFQSLVGDCDCKEYVTRRSAKQVILFDLYDWATRVVPQKGNKTKPAFVNIWLGHARQQWLRGRDDALDAIKALKTQQIGLTYAPMYVEWASIEAASDNVKKALSVVSKGLREQAQPRCHLEGLEQSIRKGTFVYRPFWTFSVDASAPLTVGPVVIESKTPGFVRESYPTPVYSRGRPTSGSQSRSGTSDDDATMMSNDTPGVCRAGAKSHHQEKTQVDALHHSRFVTPRASSAGPSRAESGTSFSARRGRIMYHKITSSCEKLAKSLPIEETTLHRSLQAIPENAHGMFGSSQTGKPLVLDSTAGCDIDEETQPIPKKSESIGGQPGGEAALDFMPPHASTPVPSGTRIKDAARAAGSSNVMMPPKAMMRPVTRKIVENENMVVVRDIQYTKLECVGKGGSSKVYKVMAPNKKIFALKRIRLNGRDQEAATGFLDEITLLTRLKGKSNIIQLIDSEVHKKDGIIYMVLECGDIDLAKLLHRHEAALQERKTLHGTSVDVDENFVRMYWEQMLHAVDTIHRERIVHSDLKPANFLMVEGQLKLIDFGIAKAIQADTTSIARESQVGTLNYMSPEAITGGSSRGTDPPTKVGRASDIWSLGCILYQMVYGKTPFAHLPFIQKMHAIIDENHAISFPPISNPDLLDVIQRCLKRHPKSRITMPELLDHPFLHPHAQTCSKKSNSIELSKEQLRNLLQKVATTGAGADVNVLSEQLFKQLVGHGPDKENPSHEAKSLKHENGQERERKPLASINHTVQ